MSKVSKALPARHDEMMDKHRRAIPSCLIGNCMKLDDFMLYGVFAIFNGHTEAPALIARAGFTKRSNGVELRLCLLSGLPGAHCWSSCVVRSAHVPGGLAPAVPGVWPKLTQSGFYTQLMNASH